MAEGFDFDQWSSLPVSDRDAFESRRTALRDTLISQASPNRQASLRRLQWRIDAERLRSGSDLGACLRLSEMMWERVLGPSGLLEALRGGASKRARALGVTDSPGGLVRESGPGTVLPFRPR